MSFSKDNEAISKYQKRVLGFTLILLVPFSLLFGVINHNHNMPGWWHSVSRTYYATDGIIMMSMFAITLIMFLSYRCKFFIERITSFFAAIATFGVLAFPHGLPEYEFAGIFMTPYHIGGKLHVIFAAMLFISYSVISILAFTKEERDFVPTKKTLLKKKIYLSTGILIIICSITLLFRIIFNLPEFLVIILETLIFEPFGVAMLIKADFFRSLRD